jgi:hypothetical protein
MKFQKRSGAMAAVVTGATLIPLVAFGGVGLAKNGGASASEYQYRVTICHLTHSKKHPMHTITISQSALAAHLRHHDTLGPCPPPPAAPTTHGSSGSHGNNGHHGKP